MISVAILGTMEYTRTGNIDLLNRRRTLKFERMNLSESVFISEDVKVSAPVIKYTVYADDSDTVLIMTHLFDFEVAGLVIVFGLHIIQAVLSLVGYGIEDGKTRKILKPLTEMSEKV